MGEWPGERFLGDCTSLISGIYCIFAGSSYILFVSLVVVVLLSFMQQDIGSYLFSHVP